MSTPLARLTHNTARRQTHTCVFQSCLENMHPLPHLSPLLACSQEIASPLCRNPTAERSPGASSTLFCYSFRRSAKYFCSLGGVQISPGASWNFTFEMHFTFSLFRRSKFISTQDQQKLPFYCIFWIVTITLSIR